MARDSKRLAGVSLRTLTICCLCLSAKILFTTTEREEKILSKSHGGEQFAAVLRYPTDGDPRGWKPHATRVSSRRHEEDRGPCVRGAPGPLPRGFQWKSPRARGHLRAGGYTQLTGCEVPEPHVTDSGRESRRAPLGSAPLGSAPSARSCCFWRRERAPRVSLHLPAQGWLES